MGFFSGLWDWFSGNSISSALAKTALVGYAAKLLYGNTSSDSGSGAIAEPDKGIRLQLDPSTDNQIPVLYGEKFFGGNITDAALSSDYKKMTYCLTLAEGTDELLSNPGNYTGYIFKGCYFDNNRVVFKSDGITVDYTLDSFGNQDITYRDKAKVYFYINGPLQPQGYSGTTPQSYTVMPGWNSTDYPMTDLIYAIVQITYDRDAGVTGLPDITWHVDTNMKKPGDVMVDYLLSNTYGAGLSVNDIDLTSFQTLNTFCNTGFSYKNLSNQTVSSSITINGLVDTTQPILNNLQEMAKACSSWISYDIYKGKWSVIINRAGSSIATFTDSNIIGDIAISGTSLTQLNSTADVKYQNTDILDKTDYVKISLPSGDLYANELGNTTEINLPFTNKQVVAAKIGLQALKQERVDKVISFKSDFSYINLKAGDLISVTSSIYGFTNKVFRIITATEIEDDNNSIIIEFKALEYDSYVYDYDITEFAVETDNGILGIGSIGKPNTPTVTKTETSNVPKIVINAQVPSGIVDAIEYWITFDTGVSEANRNYILIGRYSDPAGAVLVEDTVYSYTYTGLQQSDFYVKVRGVNGVAVGPYSDPSGLITYKPVVVADTVSDTPVSINGALMGLGLLTLLNNLDKLFSGDTSPGGLLDKIITGIKDSTGVDLAGGATVSSDIAVKDEGLQLTSKTSSIDFVGDGVTVTNAGTAVTVTIGSTGGSGGTGSGSGGTGGACSISPTYKYPPDKGTNVESYPEDALVNGISADKAPITGYYFITYTGGVYSNLIKGSGNIKLYKSDGTLVATRTANDIIIDQNTIKIPFPNRDRGTDYYIIMDQGIVKTAQGCVSLGITDPKTWNFNTPWEDINPYTVNGYLESQPAGCGSLGFVSFGVRSYFSDTINKANRQTDIRLTYNNPIVLGSSGSAKLYTSGGSLVQEFKASEAVSSSVKSELMWISGNSLYLDPTVDLTPGTTYYVTIDAGTVKDACGNSCGSITNSTTVRFTVDQMNPTKSIASSGSIDESGLALAFDRPVTSGTGNMRIYDSSNNLVATIAPTDPAVVYTTV